MDSRKNQRNCDHTLADEAETDLCKIQIYVRYSRAVTLPSTANSQLHEANATITPDRCCYCSGQALQKQGTCCFLQGRGEIRGTENIKQAVLAASPLLWLPTSDRNTGVLGKSCRSVLTPALMSLLPVLTFSGPTRQTFFSCPSLLSTVSYSPDALGLYFSLLTWLWEEGEGALQARLGPYWMWGFLTHWKEK